MDNQLKKLNIRGGFSDRNKIKPLNTTIQYESLDMHTRKSISIMISEIIVKIASYTGYFEKYKIAKELLIRLFNEPILHGEYPNLDRVSKDINEICLNGDYDDVLTMFESICQLAQEFENDIEMEGRNHHNYYNYYNYYNYENYNHGNYWYDLANQLFEKEFVGYKFIDGQICKITSQIEIDSIEEALSTPYDKVNEHMKNAISLLRESGNHDYKNSIKESILALECLFNIILDEKGLELGKALKKYFETIAIHPALKESISKLYGFASDSTGIRHDTNKESNNEGFDEAKLVLVNTSGFINFIISTKEDVESE